MKFVIAALPAAILGCALAPTIGDSVDARDAVGTPDHAPISCEEAGAWEEVGQYPLDLPEHAVIDLLSVAHSGEETFFAGMLRHRDVDESLEGDRLFVGRLEGEGPAIPEHPRFAASPRVISDSEGTVHLLWVETDTTRLEVSEDLAHLMVHRMRHVSLGDGGRWSPPSMIAEDPRGILWWYGMGAIHASQDGRIKVAAGSRGQSGSLIYGEISTDAGVRFDRLGPRTFGGYTDLQTNGDTTLIIQTIPWPTDMRRAGFGAYRFLSVDGGSTWSEPLLIPATEEFPSVTTVNVVSTPDGVHHLILGEAVAPTSGTTARYHHFVSEDLGEAWTHAARLSVQSHAEVPQLIADGCSRLHFVSLQARGGPIRLAYRRWSKSGWTPEESLVTRSRGPLAFALKDIDGTPTLIYTDNHSGVFHRMVWEPAGSP